MLGSETCFTSADTIKERVFGNVVTDADTTGRKTEPIRENTPTIVFGVKGQQSVQSVLLLTATSLTTEHLLELEGTLFPVDVLFEGIDVKESQCLALSCQSEGNQYMIYMNS